MNAVEKILSILNNSQLPENVPIKVNIDGTEYAYIHNTTNDKVEKVLLNTLIQAQGSGEWVTFTGTRVGGDLFLTLGDYDSSNNGTKIEIDDDGEEVNIYSNGGVNIIGSPLVAQNGFVFRSFGGGNITMNTSGLTLNRSVNWQDKNGTVAYIDDIEKYNEWATYSGTREEELLVVIGDYDDMNNSTKITLDDDNSAISFQCGEMRLNGKNVDTYVTGSFTPSLIDTGSGSTYTYTAFGDYVKNEKTVTINVRASITSTSGTGSGSLRFTGMPFTGKGVNVKYALSLSELSGSSLSGVDLASVRVYLDDTDITFWNIDGTALTAPTITSGDILITGTYIID